jgi:hypothetical protein
MYLSTLRFLSIKLNNEMKQINAAYVVCKGKRNTNTNGAYKNSHDALLSLQLNKNKNKK